MSHLNFSTLVFSTGRFSFPKLDKLTIFGFFQWFSYTVVCKQKRILFLDFVILRISWKYRIPPRLLVKVFAQKIHSLAKVTVTYKSFRLEEGSKRRGAQQLVLFFSVWNSHEKSPYIILEDKRDRKTFYLFPTFFSFLVFTSYVTTEDKAPPILIVARNTALFLWKCLT